MARGKGGGSCRTVGGKAGAGGPGAWNRQPCPCLEGSGWPWPRPRMPFLLLRSVAQRRPGLRKEFLIEYFLSASFTDIRDPKWYPVGGLPPPLALETRETSVLRFLPEAVQASGRDTTCGKNYVYIVSFIYENSIIFYKMFKQSYQMIAHGHAVLHLASQGLFCVRGRKSVLPPGCDSLGSCPWSMGL